MQDLKLRGVLTSWTVVSPEYSISEETRTSWFCGKPRGFDADTSCSSQVHKRHIKSRDVLWFWVKMCPKLWSLCWSLFLSLCYVTELICIPVAGVLKRFGHVSGWGEKAGLVENGSDCLIFLWNVVHFLGFVRNWKIQNIRFLCPLVVEPWGHEILQPLGCPDS